VRLEDRLGDGGACSWRSDRTLQERQLRGVVDVPLPNLDELALTEEMPMPYMNLSCHEPVVRESVYAR
jgi:hypothetical protein